MYGLNVVRELLTYDSLVRLGCLYVETTKECIMFEVILIFGGGQGTLSAGATKSCNVSLG